MSETDCPSDSEAPPVRERPTLKFVGGTHFEPNPEYRRTAEPRQVQAEEQVAAEGPVQDSGAIDDTPTFGHDRSGPEVGSPVAAPAGGLPGEARGEVHELGPPHTAVPVSVAEAYNRILDGHVSNYPVEDIAVGGQFQRGMLAGLVTACEILAGDEVARRDSRMIAANELLLKMARELGTRSVVPLNAEGRSPAKADEAVVNVLEEVLSRARKGEVLALAIVEVCSEEGTVISQWVADKHYHRLHSGVHRLAYRLASSESD